MERAEWLKKMRAQGEALYDYLAPAYWVKFGLYANATHLEFLQKLLGRLAPQSVILDAACGAGRYDGMLLEAGHRVLGADQSAYMLARAREVFPEDRFPGLRYQKMGLQEIDFRAEFNGVICIDALEHVCPEDWPGVLARFHEALRPGGALYVTVELLEWREASDAYARARAEGLPVVFGEVVDEMDPTLVQEAGLDREPISGKRINLNFYHYYPPLAFPIEGSKRWHAWMT